MIPRQCILYSYATLTMPSIQTSVPVIPYEVLPLMFEIPHAALEMLVGKKFFGIGDYFVAANYIGSVDFPRLCWEAYHLCKALASWRSAQPRMSRYSSAPSSHVLGPPIFPRRLLSKLRRLHFPPRKT